MTFKEFMQREGVWYNDNAVQSKRKTNKNLEGNEPPAPERPKPAAQMPNQSTGGQPIRVGQNAGAGGQPPQGQQQNQPQGQQPQQPLPKQQG